MQNKGVAPFYYDWPVQLGLADAANHVIAIYDTPWNLTRGDCQKIMHQPFLYASRAPAGSHVQASHVCAESAARRKAAGLCQRKMERRRAWVAHARHVCVTRIGSGHCRAPPVADRPPANARFQPSKGRRHSHTPETQSKATLGRPL